LFTIFCCAVFLPPFSGAQETPFTYPQGRIASMAVLPTSGTFLLARRQSSLCAIQFAGIWRGNDATRATTFHSGDESFRARYQWYLGEKKSTAYVIHPAKASGIAELSKGPLVGLGRLAFATGNNVIKCGPIRLFWTAPAYVYFSDGESSLFEDKGVEIALTRWTKFEQVDPNDPKLLWLRYDKNRVDSWVRADASGN
jgi:hypothetical protein